MLFNQTMSVGEKLIFSLAITILGMLVVFAVLVIIAYSLKLLKLLFEDKDKKKFTVKEELISPQESIAAAQNNTEMEMDPNLIAVLTAAIMAHSGNSSEEMIIKSIMPVKQKNSIWASAGRQEQMLKTI